jgi:hypothetical protein
MYEMRKGWFACATILILCHSLSLEINTTYGEQRISLVRPVETRYPISQPFGPSSDQTLQEAYKKWGYEGHFGVDYACPVGTDIYTCDDGEVFEVNNSNPKHPNGLYVRIKHKWGSSVYCHLSNLKVKNGERVAKYLIIGSSGKTGYVTGAHLHFGLKISGISNPSYKDYINPLEYASFESPVTQLSTSKTTKQKKLSEVVTLPEYSQETLLLRKRIKVYKSKLLSVSSKLLRNIPNPPSIEFKLTASDEVNVWADGRITMGLMDFLYSNPTGNPDDKLAMIIAHIVAHKKLDTETVNKMLGNGLDSSKDTYNDIISGVSYAVSAVLPTPFTWASATVLDKVSKEIVNWITEKTLKTFQGDQDNTSHFFSVLYVNKAGFDASEGLKIFNNPTAFSRHHPIDLQFWEDYAKEIQAKLDNERPLASETLTEQKKSHELAKLTENPQETLLPKKVTIEDGLIKQKGSYKIYLLIDGKKYFIPDRATLNSLNFGGQNVRVLTSNVFNNIPEGNSVEAKKIFALRKKGKLLTTQKVQKLPPTRGFDIPKNYTRTNKKIEEPSTKSNFLIPEVYRRDKGYSSQNVPSYYQGIEDPLSRFATKEITKQPIFKSNLEGQHSGKFNDCKAGHFMAPVWLATRTIPSWLDYGAHGDFVYKGFKRDIPLQGLSRDVLRYNQNLPYQTTSMITNQSKEKSAGYAAGLEMITNKDKEKNAVYTDDTDWIIINSTSGFNTQYITEDVKKVLKAFERWLTDYYMEEIKHLAVNKKYFTTVNAMNLKKKGIEKVWDSIILHATDTNDIVRLEKAIEVYKDLIKSELRIIKNQK